MQLERGVVHLVLVSHVVHQAAGGEGADAQLNGEPGGRRGLSERNVLSLPLFRFRDPAKCFSIYI